MRLYVDYNLYRSDAGPSAIAHAAVRRATSRIMTVVLAGPDRLEKLHRLTGARETPVLVTTDGDTYAGVPAIVAWVEAGA